MGVLMFQAWLGNLAHQ